MNHAEQEALVNELESRLERLRALYEQYFMGIEKLEPMVPRKDVDRRINALRHEQMRNTGLRFKFNTLTARYVTLSTHWGRILRQIEKGTYKRDLMRAQKRFGTAPLTEAARRRAGMGRTLDEIQAGVAAQVAAAPQAELIEESDFLDAEMDEEDDDDVPTPPRASLIAPAPIVVAPPVAAPKAESIPPPSVEAIVSSAGRRRPATMRGLRLPLSDAEASEAPPPVMAPPPVAALPPVAAPKPPPPKPAAPIAAPPPIAAAPKPAPVPVVAPPPAAPPSRPVKPKQPHVMLSLDDDDLDMSMTSGPPSFVSRMEKAPPAPKPVVVAPKPVAAAPKPEPRPAPKPEPKPVVTAPKPEPKPTPKTVAEKPVAPVDGLSESRVREIYGKYVAARQQNNESTAAVTLEGISRSLRESGAKLREKHGGKDIDFDVVVRDGKTVLKPVVKLRVRRWLRGRSDAPAT